MSLFLPIYKCLVLGEYVLIMCDALFSPQLPPQKSHENLMGKRISVMLF